MLLLFRFKLHATPCEFTYAEYTGNGKMSALWVKCREKHKNKIKYEKHFLCVCNKGTLVALSWNFKSYHELSHDQLFFSLFSSPIFSVGGENGLQYEQQFKLRARVHCEPNGTHTLVSWLALNPQQVHVRSGKVSLSI